MGSPPSRAIRLGAIGLPLLVLAAYGATIGFDFVQFDDLDYVVHNANLGEGLSPATLRWAFTTDHASWWHPVTWVSLLVDVSLYRGWAGGFHLTAALLHALNSALALLVLVRVGLSERAALLAAALFALHPLRVESVAWVSERKDVLSVCFGLLTVLAFLAYRRTPSLPRYLGVIALFALALASKVMLMTLPVSLLVVGAVAPGRDRSLRRLAAETLPLLALSAGAAAMMVRSARAGGAMASLASLPVSERLAGAVVALGGYVEKTLVPLGLCCMVPRRAFSGVEVAAALATVLLVTAVAVALALRRRPALLVGWGLFLVCVSPVLGLVQAGEQLMADRYTYLGHLALFGGLVATAPPLWLTRPAVLGGAVAWVLVLFGLTLAQVQTWRDTDTLYAHALEVLPDNPPIQRRVDGLVVERALSQGRLDDALAAAQLLVERWPTNGRVWILAGTASARAGRFDEAIARFTRALQLEPGNRDAERFLAYAREDRQRAGSRQ